MLHTFSETNLPNSEVVMCIELCLFISNNQGNDDTNYAFYRFVNVFLPKTSTVLWT
jgi:hypothetical protein